MNNFAQKKPDYVFIASLVAIIFVAIFLAMDRFQDSEISNYLNKKGQELLAQIDNQEERENLQSDYNDFIEKVADREVDPQRVEQFVSSIINLNQSKRQLNKDEFAHIFERNLIKAVQPDTLKRVYRENEQRWKKLQERLLDINIFEEKVKEVSVVTPELKNSYSFSYTIDDTLNIIIHEGFRDNLEKQAELAKELKRLEEENTLKWQKGTDVIMEKHGALQEAMIILKETEAAMSVIAIEIDSARVSNPVEPVVIETPETPVIRTK